MVTINAITKTIYNKQNKSIINYSLPTGLIRTVVIYWIMLTALTGYCSTSEVINIMDLYMSMDS